MTKPDTMQQQTLSRRTLLKGSGALVVSFSLAACGMLDDDEGSGADPTPTQSQQEVTGDEVPGSTVTPVPRATEEERSADAEEYIDSWLAVDDNGDVTVYCGKVELGTGVTTALSQIVAEELNVALDRIQMIMGDTAQTEDQGYTAGSKTIQVAGPVLRSASAEARIAMLELAAEELQASQDELTVQDGTVSVQGGSSDESVTFGELVTGEQFNRRISDDVTSEDPENYTIVGESIPRVDIPGKLTGQPSYVQDHRVPEMLHGRIVRPWVLRPDGVNASVQDVNEDSISDIPGIVQVVRDGNFVGVVAEREEQAIQAAEQLEVTWEEDESLPPHDELYQHIRDSESEEQEPVNEGDVESAFEENGPDLEVTYHFPFQAHASMGPSCAVADVQNEQATIWSSTQGVYPLRGALAELLDMPAESIQVVHMEGAGCYGHNGFDDVSGDAAMLSRAVGQPVRVQWMREDEFAWEPKGPAMVMDVRGSVSDDGEIAAWEFEGWTPTHTTRPGGQARNLIAGKLVESDLPEPDNPNIGGDRNAPTTYEFPDVRVATNYLETPVLRSSALRTLGAMANAFANESFMDEMAAEAGVDPVEFRLSHLSDERAAEVINAAAEEFGWETRPSPAESDGSSGTATGRGIAYAQYENENAYVATVAEVDVNRDNGEIQVRRVVAAHDCGLIINPDGLTNQIEGNVIQATSRTLKEEVAWDESLITTLDWASYPILTFEEVPEVQAVLIDRPEEPAVGAGEPASVPVAAAIGNAVFDATGARLRTIPFTPERVQSALG